MRVLDLSKFFPAAIVLALLVATIAPVAAAQDSQPPIAGAWGGEHVALEAHNGGATLEFDCAHGTILEAIKPDAQGAFTARGTFTAERGGPIRRDNPPRDVPAVYKGTIAGDVMHLSIMLGDGSNALEDLTLTRGQAGVVRKCR